MRAIDIPAEEAKYQKNWVRSGEATKARFGNVDVFDFKPKHSSDYFFDERPPKNLVVLHYTQGWIWGDIPTLTTDHFHVSVAFVVARSGIVYRLFPEDRWSFHLGREQDVTGGSEFNSRRSIAIEVSNVGPLALAGNDLKFVGKTYCTTAETDFYQKLASPYRGHQYFATFTGEQYTAVSALLDQIKATYGIARSFLPQEKRFAPFESEPAADAYKGIASHVNYRPTGKTDIGPAFNWAKIGA
jgi:N-acetyl-anhydromuramyl-L-alanine amidase AmpD